MRVLGVKRRGSFSHHVEDVSSKAGPLQVLLDQDTSSTMTECPSMHLVLVVSHGFFRHLCDLELDETGVARHDASIASRFRLAFLGSDRRCSPVLNLGSRPMVLR